MTVLAFAVGGILTATGVIAYFASDASSMTALIPAALGVLILIAAFVARAPKARRHALHAALAIALLGIAGTAMNVMKLGELFAGTAERPNAVIASTVTFVVLLVFLAAGIASFVRARRYRAAQTPTNAPA
ncbi:hypothetical protein [Leucobacter triazinivorans]|uniref:Uncharacterized protein n=1 Tax=Leucobacter triazinivorans TaxID=1784719 RepID=A0A4P6KHX2_9MICO|nr:hypothetical protein [Leucobacter triazinivorans]QBE49588.1 hypothetical protein EVS81_12750 [Leucobacter triazinivorans]